MLEANRRRVQQLTGLEIWFFILARVRVAFALGVIAMAHFPDVARLLALPALIAGIILFAFASKGLRRKPTL